MTELKICIVEDEAIIAESIRDLLESLGYYITGIASTYYEAIELAAREMPDLFLLDITLKGSKTGIDFAHYINEKIEKPFIFLTAHSDVSTLESAKKAMPSAYLMKPFSKSDLYSAIEIAAYNFNNKKLEAKDQNLIFVKHMDVYYKIHYTDIVFVESEHVYIMLHTLDEKKYLFRKTLSSFVEELPANLFVRIHRGYAINLNHVQAVNATHIVMKGNHTLPLGKVYKDQLFQVLGLG